MEHIFDRFKYAEEFAHKIDTEQGPGSWTMTRRPDKIVKEDGEEYRIPQYVVEVDDVSIVEDLPVYMEDWNKRIGTGTFYKETGLVQIEVTDPEMVAWLKQDILASFSLGSISFADESKKEE